MLTDQRCRAAKARDKPYKLADSMGLHLYVSTTGHRSWRMKYRFGGKERRLVFGAYPEVSLKEARDLRDEARRLLRRGEDPGAARKAATAASGSAVTLETIARQWHANQSTLWTKKHAAAVLDSLVDEVFPTLGSKPIGAITPPQIRELLEKIQARGAVETAHRIRGRLSAIHDMAIAAGLADSDPAAAVGKALKPIRKGRQPALLKLEQARDFLEAVEALPAHPLTKLASRLIALTAVRPGVVRFTPRIAEFEELDGEAPLWRIPPERMKLPLEEKEDESFEFLVPLSRQAVDVIVTAQQLVGRGPYLFPNTRHAHRPMSENAVSFLYKRLADYRRKHVPHGWRSSFSTIMNERAVELERPGDRPIIDLMLAHKPGGVEAIYNRAAYMPRRRQLAQEWADLLLEGFPPASSLLDGPRK